jgi:hypothetical protein
MKLVSPDAAADLLTRYAREAGANSLKEFPKTFAAIPF